MIEIESLIVLPPPLFRPNFSEHTLDRDFDEVVTGNFRDEREAAGGAEIHFDNRNTIFFREKLNVESGWGIKIEGIPGGDYDVLGFLDSIMLYIECKISPPDNVEDGEWSCSLSNERKED